MLPFTLRMKVMNEEHKSYEGKNYTLVTLLGPDFKTMDFYAPKDCPPLKREQDVLCDFTVDKVGKFTYLNLVKIKNVTG